MLIAIQNKACGKILYAAGVPNQYRKICCNFAFSFYKCKNPDDIGAFTDDIYFVSLIWRA